MDNKATESSTASVYVVTVKETTSETANIAASFYVVGTSPWMIDSGCIKHITNNLNNFTEYEQFKIPSVTIVADMNQT